MKKINMFRVSKSTNPKSLASSIVHSLSEDSLIKITSIGYSAMIVVKSLAIINAFKDSDVIYIAQPNLEYIKDDSGTIKSAIVWTVEVEKL